MKNLLPEFPPVYTVLEYEDAQNFALKAGFWVGMAVGSAVGFILGMMAIVSR